MKDNNDVWTISGRIKNLIAKENIAISPAGIVLVNIQTHFLKQLYDVSEKYLPPYESMVLNSILRTDGEDLPRSVISILTPNSELELNEEDEEVEYSDE